MRNLVVAGATLMIGCLSLNAQNIGTIQWSIDSDPSHRPGDVQLAISRRDRNHNSNWSSGFPLADLQGLSAGQLNAAGSSPVRFALVRDAGRLDCAGNAGRGDGRGTCSFTADPAFASYLASRGIGRPDDDEAYQLTMSGAGRELLDALAANRYPMPDIDQLVAMGIHGVSPRFVQELAAAGYRLGSVDDLVTFRIHGVSPEFIRDMAAIGPRFRGIVAKDLVTFRIHGVSPEYVRAIAAAGPQFANLDADDLVTFRIHGVWPELVQT